MKKTLLLLTMCLMALSNAFGAVTWYLNEDFESGQIPTGWTQEVVSSNVANWLIEPTTSATYPASGNESNYYVALRNTTGIDQHYVTRLISPEINFAGASYVYLPQLVFNHAQPGYGNDFDTLKIYYRQNANAEWALLKVFSSRMDDWTIDTVPLLGYAGATTYQLAFESVENMGRGIVVDDVTVVNKSACQPVSEVAAPLPGSTSVTLTWAGDQAADSFEVVLSKTEITDWSSFTPAFHAFVHDFSIQIDNLEPSTDYYAYVRSSCNDNETGWTDWAMGTFKTRARILLPYAEDFSSALPYGWLSATDMTSTKPSFSSATATASTLASYSVDSTFAMQFGSISAGKYAIAISPEVAVSSLQGVEVGFWGYAGTNIRTPHNSYVAKMYVGVMTDPEDATTLVIVDSVEIKVASKHQHFTVSFENYQGSGKYLAFVVSDPARTSYFYIDHLTVEQPAVLTPTDVQITNAGPEGFDVKVNLHGATQWNLRVADAANYKHMNVLPSSFLVSQDGISGNTYHVSGSFGDQIVAVYAQGVSGNNTSSWSFPTTLRIPARATLPIQYEFDEEGSLLVKSLDNEIHINSTVKTYTGMYFPLLDLTNFYPKYSSSSPKYNNTSHLLLQGIGQYIALPYVDSFEGQMVSFRLAAATAGQSRVAVGIMRDAYDLSTFTQLAEYNGTTGDYRKCEVNLTGKESLGHYVAIVAIKPSNPSSSYGSVNHIDALHIEDVPPCPEALDINAVVADTTISLTWDPRGMNHWLVELFDGSNPDSLLASTDVTTPSAVIGGLTTQTDYYYRVNTWCGTDTLRGNGKVKFTTKCDLISTFPWSEDFNDMGTGNLSVACWGNEHTAGSGTTKFSVSTTTYGNNTTKKLYTASMTAGNIARLSLPEMNLPNDRYEFLISVWRSSTSPTKVNEGLRIFASDGENETELAFIPRYFGAASSTIEAEEEEDWYTYQLPIGLSGICGIIVQAEGEGGAAIYMDDMMVRPIPACQNVKALKVTNITSSSATVTWTPRGNEAAWQYLLVASGSEIDWSNAVTVNAPTVALTGLGGSTSYDIYVRAACGASEQSEPVMKSFRTDCGTISTLPWTDGFEAYEIGSATNPTLNCWTILGAAATTSTYPQVYVYNSSTYVKSGSKSLYFKSSKDSCVYVVFPPFAAPLNTLKLAFSHKEESETNSGIPVVGYVTDPNDASTFVALAQYTRLTKIWQDEELILSDVPAAVASTARLAFRYGGSPNNNYFMGVDDITISEVDFSCPGINELTAVSPTPTAISIAWTSPGTQAVDIEVSDSADFSVKRSYPAVPTSPLVVNGLEQNHYYYVRARQVCDTEGEWKSVVVKTLCDAVNPETYPMQDFEAADDLDCWLVGVSVPGKQATTDPSIGSLAARGKYLYFNKAATTSDTITKGDGLYAIMPMLDVDSITKYEISFNAFKTTTAVANAGKLAIGVITDPSDFSTFTLVQNLRLEYAADSLSEKSYTVNFLNYTGDFNDDYGKYIVFYAQSGDSINAIGVDKVIVRRVASCPQVAEGAVSDITSESAIYRWPGTGAAAYEVRVLTEQVDPDQAEIIPSFVDTVTVDSVVISGLSSARTYFAYVRALCGPEDVSRWSSYTRFRTLCGVTTIPYSESFNEAEALQCYTVGNMQSTSATYTPSLQTTSTYLYKGTYVLRIYSYNSSSTHADSAYAILPDMNFGTKGLKGHTLSFYGRSYGSTSSYYKHLKVGVVSGTDMKTFRQIQDITLTDNHALYEVSFDNYAGEGDHIALMTTIDPTASSTTTGYCYAYLDEISVFQTPTCKSIGELSANAGRRTIDVTITAKENGVPDHYDLVCSTTELDEAALEAAEKISVDTTGLYTVTGLDRETLYYLYARANCGPEDGASEWSSISITTKGLYGCDDYKTVGEGTTTTSGPICGLYGFERNGYIFTPADGLTPGRIGSLTWNYFGTAAKPIPCKIYLKNTTETEFVNTLVWNTIKSDATLVYEGIATLVPGLIEFEITPFIYTGGNLMILVESNVTGSGGASVSAYYTAFGSNNHFYIRKDTEINDNQPYSEFSTKGLNNQRHNLRFGFCYDIAPCPTISDLSTELLGAGISEAMLRWTASEGDYLSGYDVIVSDSVVTNPDSIAPTYANIQGDSLHVTGLNPETLYHVYVRAICKAEGHDEGVSQWIETTFETLANCPAVVGLTSELYSAATTVRVSWTTALEEQELHFAYVYSTDSLDKAALLAAEKHYVNDTLDCTISGLAYGQKYYIYVASVCGASFSPWSQTVITTDAACAPVRNLEIARLEHNRVILNWNPSRFGSETQWEAGIVGDSASVVMVNDTNEVVSTMLIGLTPATQYTAYVRAICGVGETSEIRTIQFTTKDPSSGCVTIGQGTGSDYTTPFNNLYKNAWTQIIYTADEIGANGNIASIWFNCTAVSTTSLTQNVTIYLAHTTMDLASTTSSWVPEGDLVQVYSRQYTHPTQTGWIEFTFDTPFAYNGTDNLALIVSTHADAYQSGFKYEYTTGTSGVSMYRRSDSDASCGEYPTATGTKGTYKPNIQFCFEQSSGCAPVTNLKVQDVTTTTAVASWEPMGSERSWEVYVADTTIFDFTGLRLDTAFNYVYPMTGLQDDKDYWFYVRPICGGDWKVQKFTTVAICSAPIELDVDSVTSYHARISWTDAFSVGSSYIVAYGLADSLDLSNPATYRTMTVSTPYAWLTDLEQVTMYAFAVRSVCAEGLISRFSEIETFQTPCAVKPLNWFDSFENEVYCWYVGNRQSSSSSYIPSIISSATTSSNAVYVHTGVRAFKMYTYKYTGSTSSTNADSAYVIVPEIDYGPEGIQGAAIRFYARSYGSTTAYYKHVQIGVIKNRNIRTYQKVKDIDLTDQFEKYEVSFANYIGEGDRIVFLATVDPNSTATTRYGYVYFDDFEVIPTPTCWRPETVSVVSVAGDSASFAWTPGANETQWQYEYTPYGVVPSWTNAVITDTTAATVHGISPSSTYQFHVRSYCSATDQSDYRSATFASAECGVVTQLPWKEGFEAYEASTYSATAVTYVPACWDMIKSASATNYPHVANGGSYAYPHSGSKVLVTYTTDTCYAILPQFAAPLDELQITFYYRTYNTANSGFVVFGYVTADEVFHPLKQYDPIATMTKDKVLLNNLPDSLNARLAFMYTGGTSSMYNFNLDDITVSYINYNCAGVSNARVSGFTQTSATIEWGYTLGNHAAQVEIATDVNFNDLVDSTIVMNDSIYMCAGLQKGTKYYVRVRQVCDEDEYSEWSETASFTTSYGLPFLPRFTSTTVPSDWMRSNTTAAQVFAGTAMATETAGWNIVAADTVINNYHVRGNIYGTSWHHWLVTPAIDMTQNLGDGILLSFDAGLVAFSAAKEDVIYTGVDDRFLVAISTDGGITWNAENVIEWNNAGTGQYVYNDVPKVGTRYYINMSDYAGSNVKIGFYGESSVTNADNNFHFGNIRLETVETTTYVDTICEGYSFNKNGFFVSYDDLQVGLNVVSRYEMNVDSTMNLTLQQIWVMAASVYEIPVELCEGEHYNGYGFDVTVTQSESIRKRIDGGNQFGCDSTAILQITMLPTIRTELIVGCNEESYTWHGKTYYQSTIVDDTTSSVVTGCDSITTLHLTFCAGEHYRYHNAFCQGGSYSDEFFENLTAPGEYKGSRTDMIGCVTNAELTLHQLAPGQNYVDSVHVSKLPYVLGNDTLCPETDQPGYVYHGSADFGCGLVNVTIYVYDKVALDNIAAGTLQVAPNPVRIGEDIRILTSIGFTSDYSCRVFDAVGKLVYESFEPATTIPGLPVAGAYTIRISAGNTIYQGKLIVK